MKPLSIATLSALSSLRTPHEKQEKQGDNAAAEIDPSADAFAEFMNVPGDSPAMPPVDVQAPVALRVLRWADPSAPDDVALVARSEGAVAQGALERDFAHSATARTAPETVMNWRKSLREMIESEGLKAEAAVPAQSPAAPPDLQRVEAEPTPAPQTPEHDITQTAETSALTKADATAVVALAGLAQSQMDIAPEPKVDSRATTGAQPHPMLMQAPVQEGPLPANFSQAEAEPPIRRAELSGLQAGSAPLNMAKTVEIPADVEPLEPPQLAPAGQVPAGRPAAYSQPVEAASAVADKPLNPRPAAPVESVAMPEMVADAEATQDRPTSHGLASPEQGARAAPTAVTAAVVPEVMPQAPQQPLGAVETEVADQVAQPQKTSLAVSAPVAGKAGHDHENGTPQAEAPKAPRVESVAMPVTVADLAATQDRLTSPGFDSPDQGARGAPTAATAPEVMPQAPQQPLGAVEPEVVDQVEQPEKTSVAVSASVTAEARLDRENGKPQAEEATAPAIANAEKVAEAVSGAVSEPRPASPPEDASAPEKDAAPTAVTDPAEQIAPPREQASLSSQPGLAGEVAVSEKRAESGVVPGSAVSSPSHRSGASHGLGPQVAEALVNAPNRAVELTLAPEELGKVRMTLHAQDSTMTVAVQAERPETLDLMRRHIDSLAREFREMGYADVSFDFGQQSNPQPKPHEQVTEAPRTPEPTPAGLFQSAELAAPVNTHDGAGGLDLRM